MSGLTASRGRQRATPPIRGVVAAALAVAAVLVIGVVLFSGEDRSLTIHARFANAGQLVTGSPVQVAGRGVGRVTELDVTPDGQADVTVSVTDPDVLPLRRGTRASIRAFGQAGAANRYVELTPGPERGTRLIDGDVLTRSETFGIVDLDAILNAFDGRTREDLRTLIARSAEVFSGSTAPAFNRVLEELRPTVASTADIVQEITDDREALRGLIATAATTARAVASRRPDLREAITDTARTFEALNRQRGAVNATLRRTPGFVTEATRALTQVRRTAARLTPTLRRVPAAAAPLQTFLRTTTRSLAAVDPVLDSLSAQLPDLGNVLRQLAATGPSLSSMLRSVAGTLADADPILAGTRVYTPDFLLGIFNGFAGLATGNYTRVGHYARLEFVQSPQTFLGGSLGGFLPGRPLVPGLFDVRTHLVNRCPGSMAPPAPDGSSPWNLPGLCDPTHGTPASVNEP